MPALARNFELSQANTDQGPTGRKETPSQKGKANAKKGQTRDTGSPCGTTVPRIATISKGRCRHPYAPKARGNLVEAVPPDFCDPLALIPALPGMCCNDSPETPSVKWRVMFTLQLYIQPEATAPTYLNLECGCLHAGQAKSRFGRICHGLLRGCDGPNQKSVGFGSGHFTLYRER